MTATGARREVARLSGADAWALAERLGDDFGRDPSGGTTAVGHHPLLDALDRGEHRRFWVWPQPEPGAQVLSLVYAGAGGTIVPAGDPAGAEVLAAVTERAGWRVLVGDAPLGDALLDVAPKGLFRRRVNAREQRLMAVLAGDARPGAATPPGFRAAQASDVDALTELACRLHVEDRMGPPIARSARPAVRARMSDSVRRVATYVVADGDVVLAKADVAVRSSRRGAQVAGVYVDPSARGRGLASGAVAAMARRLLDDGAPLVSLHVRADNAAGVAAYRRAGLTDRAPWVLALR